MSKLTSKVALITEAKLGIGQAIQFAQQGASAVDVYYTGQPAEIAKLALFLALTGSTYVMDGGFMRMVAQGA